MRTLPALVPLMALFTGRMVIPIDGMGDLRYLYVMNLASGSNPERTGLGVRQTAASTRSRSGDTSIWLSDSAMH